MTTILESPKLTPKEESDAIPLGNVRKRQKRSVRIVVAGQVPPPICGQNLNIARILRLFQELKTFRVEHWAFKFTPDWSQIRRAGWRKAIEVFRVWGRLMRLRCRGRIDVTLYPVGGPHLVPLVRDILLLPLALLCSRRVVLHFQAAGLAESLPGHPAILRWVIGFLYRRCGHAVSLTEYGCRDPEAAGIPRRNVVVIPNATEDRYHSHWRRPRNRLEEPITILNAGLLCPDKGTPALIEAFGRVVNSRKDLNLRLRLAGDPMGGCTRKSLCELVREWGLTGRVEFCGVLRGDNLDRAYAEADLFAFATVANFESFGLVLIEAMMWNLPIIATDWRANAEVLGTDPGGVLAEDVEDDLVGSLETALKKALSAQPRWEEWGQRNRNRYLAEFQIGQLKERLRKLIS